MAGVSSLEELCEAVRAQGADTLALTDTNGLYGAIRFVDVARHHGLKPILGAEVTHKHHRAVLLIKAPEGYANLCRLLSARHSDGDFELIKAVAKYWRGLVVCSDDLAALMAWKQLRVRDLYVELTPGKMMHQALAFSRQSGIPPVATNRIHFVHPDEYAVHRILRAIALNTTLSQLPQEECCAPYHWLAPASVLEPQYPHVPHALTNTCRIAQRCYSDWNFKETIFPTFRQLSDGQAFTLLKEKTYHGALWRYGAMRPEIHTRIQDELAVIQSKGFAHSFLVVEEIVRQAPRTCGRGSAAASIVSFCLGITHVDPIRHNLFFERFLNVGRHDPPDIDIDFPWDERDRILDFVFAHYGADRVAMVANHNTLALRAAIREVAKVYGIPSDEISRIVPHLFRHLDFHQIDHTTSLTKGLSAICHTQGLADPWPEVLLIAVRVQGRFQRLGLHCGGVVIVPDEIRRYVPVQVAAKGVPMIQWEKDQTEDAGLLKLDLLGNRSLAVIRDAIEAIARNTGCRLDYATWDPLSDAPTQDLIRRGDTIGCFYIESPATRLLLKKLWMGMPRERQEVADLFEYLVIVSSLVRPAANRYIREFVRRAHGCSYQPLHPRLEEVLKETHGIMVYQEDVTKVAMALAGFNIEDADQLRKVLTKKHKQRQLQDYKSQFFRGAQARGVSHVMTQKIWDMIMSFAGYSFCKPHSASYAQVSFKSAYLRAHYPAEFMAAVISNQGGFYSTFAYLSEARRMGLAVLPPDINASAWHYTGHGQAIRMGLMQLKGLKQELAERLLAERSAKGPYRSFQEFLARVRPEPAQARCLIKASCCDSIAGEVTRPGLLWRVHAHHPPPLTQKELMLHGTQALPIPPDYTQEKKIHHEIAFFGFPLSIHPLTLYAEWLDGMEVVPANEMPQYVNQRVTMVGWLITEKPAQTKQGEAMEFISLEDQTGLYDATLFPNTYRRFGHLLRYDRPLIVEGQIEEEFQTVTLTVDRLRVPEALPHRGN